MITKVSMQQIKSLLGTGELKKLFIEELGWNRLKETALSIPYKGQSYIFDPLAEKGGFKIYTCTFTSGPIADDKVLKQLDRQLELYAHEKLIIFLDASRTNQVWLWVKREVGKPATPRINKLYKGQSAELLAQKLSKIAFGIEEEDTVDVIGTYGRIKSGFDVDKVTTKFYERFKKEHTIFLGHIQGIPTDDEHKDDREWYASLMLNRLMFVYFIQKKGLLDNTSKQSLDGDKGYLQKRLQKVQDLKGNDVFYTFYRYFLRRLFHEGLSKPELEREPELEQIIGHIPYINGGLFDVHMLEQKYPDIQIIDEAFETLFSFFEDFDWYLDDRPARKGNEINPDVLGYIFEKYINQKQMGAYYTKEDITEYISKNTIIPYLFEKAAEQCPIAFTPAGPVWSLLCANPDDYIYEAASWGTNELLPEEIEVGVHDISQRTLWNKVAPAPYALPAEIWREVVARRQRYDEVRTKMVSGEITSINDLITYNLDITRFAQDVIAYCEGTDLLQAFYNAIEKVTVLDPTCGSGAFLFAALNILKPLYEACLKRMRVLVTERDSLDAALPVSQRKVHNRIDSFRRILARVEQHPSQEYFILKSIVINNLYGVDIMEEAVEICKLRLFLKLVAQIQKPDELEPLPDIDFNVMAGNTLIGYTNLEDVRRIIGQNVFAGSELGASLASIEEQAKEIERSEKYFRSLQTDYAIESIQEYKQLLRNQLNKLRADLNPYLAYEYGINYNNMPQEDKNKQSYEKWLKTHQPFHWWIEFYEIMDNGVFDVVIGNPPYVEYKDVKRYKVKGYKTINCSDLFAFTLERSIAVTSSASRTGFIVPMSCFTVDGFKELQDFYLDHNSHLFISNWSGDAHPSKLFEGVDKRLEIILTRRDNNSKNSYIFSTKYLKWYSNERSQLFHIYPMYHQLKYLKQIMAFPTSIPKFGSYVDTQIVQKLQSFKNTVGFLSTPMGENKLYYTRKASFFLQFLDFIPEVRDNNGQLREPSELKTLSFKDKYIRNLCLAALSSNLFYWFYITNSDCRNLNKREIISFPIPKISSSSDHGEIEILIETLMASYQRNSTLRTVDYAKKGKITVQYFNFRPSKAIIDEIDRVLAKHYGFTDEEVDFIINYDVKYRTGINGGSEK